MKKRLNEKLDAELKFHLDRLIKDKMAKGFSETEARRQAVLEFGGTEQLKEELRDIHRLPFIETAWTNLRFAFRMIRKSPTFSATVVLTLALGIGANSAVFSAINAILLRALPFPRSSELVELRQVDHTSKTPFSLAAPARVEDWNRMNSTFQGISGYYTSDISDTSGDLPEKVTEALIAPRFFKIWGIHPALGRDFLPQEEHFGGPDAVVISHRYWMHRFNGDPAVIGKKVRFEGSAVPIVGVMPANFRFQDHDVDLWVNSPVDAPYAQSRDSTWYYQVVGRLKPDVSLAEASANLAYVQKQLGKLYPGTDQKLGVDLQPLKDLTVGESKRSLWLLYGSVSLLLLIACINIAALLMARSAERQREISVRFSLGASRSAIIWQLLTECFLLSLAGAGLGLGLATAGSALFRQYAIGFPRRDEIALDWHIVVYTLGSAVIATLLFGLIPAVRGTRRDIHSALNQFTRSHVSAKNPIQWLLVSTQVALAVMLLMGAGLMVRSFQKLGQVEAGFDTSHVLTFRISANWGETMDMKKLSNRIDRTLAAIRETPGVVAAATTALLPGITSDSRAELKLVESASEQSGKLVADSRFISDGYFATMKIPILSGEPCRHSSALFRVAVNRSFVSAYLHGSTPLGKHVAFFTTQAGMEPAEITGIVADSREQGLAKESQPTVYWCVGAPNPSPYFVVQTRGEPMAMAETLRHAIHNLEPARSVYAISPLQDHLSNELAPNKLRTFLLLGFALSAIALAATGLYGTLSYFVTVRRRECGLRLALGATRGQLIQRFFAQGLASAAIGCAVGLGLSAAFTKTLSGFLYGIDTRDAVTWGVVTVTVLGVAAFASLIPSARAASVEPMVVLREE